MVIILFFGLLFIIFFFFAMCCISCIVCCAGKESGEGAQSTIEKLTSNVYDPAQFEGNESCRICLEDFKKDDTVTPLPCNSQHFFHTACINQYIEADHRACCPICRASIGSGLSAEEIA
jgi:hypothetical protein